MKKKRIVLLIIGIALIAAVLVTVLSLTRCGGSIRPGAEQQGAEIPVYLAGELYNLDPTQAYLNDAGVKVLGLIYEGLFKLDDNGKVQKALCDSYTTSTTTDGEFVLDVTIKDSKWSDGRSVSANDFVYAFKRIIEPEFSSQAASLLFDLKNARECKRGDISIDDLGVVATETKVLRFTFANSDVDVDRFIEYLASPALVPLREDKVARLDDWASYYVTMVTNGPFYVKIFEPGTEKMVLERSIYYYRDTDNEGEYLDRFVKPYRLIIDFSYDNSGQLSLYNNDMIVYDGELPLESRAEYENDVTTDDMLNTHTYYFNNKKAPFDNADVRKALSLAIDRNEIVNIVTYATAAEGIIPQGIFNTDRGTSFRDEGGSLISADADMNEAKSLIKSANPEVKEFSITVRPDETEQAVAEYVKGVWEELGFTVEIKTLAYESYQNIEYDQYRDLYYQAYSTGDFDVIAVDAQMLSTDAFPMLASFAKEFSGQGMDLTTGDYNYVTHISGYDNEDYSALIESAYGTTDRSERAEYLHEAEQLLIDDMPVMPLFVFRDAYIKSSGLKNITDSFFGLHDFKSATLKNYEAYLTEETE